MLNSPTCVPELIEFAVAPATGTPETGGWTTRELRTIIRGLEGINLIATDIVEVAPAYDTNAELTTMGRLGRVVRGHDFDGQEGTS